MKRKILGIVTAFVMGLSLIVMPTSIKATSDEPKQEGNKVYLQGNDAEIVVDPENPDGAIVKSAGKEFKIKWDSNVKVPSCVIAGSKKGEYGTVNITMHGGKVNYIYGGNENLGTVDTTNVIINNGFVNIVYGTSLDSTTGSINNCKSNQTINTNIIMNGGEAQALVPGSFGYSYVKNANVTLNGGTLQAKSSPMQAGILGGTNGFVENLTINVNGGSTKDIALGQRTMITGKATLNIKGGSVGNIYAGSYYDDGDNAAGTTNWNGWEYYDVNYGQAAAIDINIEENVQYNDIYAGFQFLDQTIYAQKYVNTPEHFIKDSDKIIVNLSLASKPAKIRGEKEKHTVSVIDSMYANTKWIVTGISLDKTSAELTVGESTKLNATINPTNATDQTITWSSSNDNVATVVDGVVTTKTVGTTEITVKAGDKTATCLVVVKPVQIETPIVDTTKPVEEVTVGVNDKASQDVISEVASTIVADIIEGKNVTSIDKQTAENLKKAVDNKQTITTEVKVEKISADEVNKEAKATIIQLVSEETTGNKTSTIVEYLDLSIILKANGTELGTVNELGKEVAFTVAIPEELIKEGRVFYVVRVHEGVAEKLPVTLNEDGTITFKTDKFSTYALVYEDGEATTPITPTDDKKEEIKSGVDTGDTTNTTALITLMGLAVVVAGGTLVSRKKLSK